MHLGVTFNFGSAKVCSPAIFQTCYTYDKDIWIAATLMTNIYGLLHWSGVVGVQRHGVILI